MYVISVILLLLVLPVACAAVEYSWLHSGGGLLLIAGRWFVFWAAGVRLFVAGIRQVIQPSFTAREIFGLEEVGALAIVRELGFANLSMGLLSLCSVVRPGWVLPGAVVGGLYYGLAGVGHIAQQHRNLKENVALISDVWIFLMLAWFVFVSLR